MTERAQKLINVGNTAAFKASDAGQPRDIAMLHGIAAMIDAALPEKKASKSNQREFDFGRQAYAVLADKAPDAVIWSPCTRAQVVALGKVVLAAEMDMLAVKAVADWIAGGGLDWMKEKPTMKYIAANFVDLIARSREAAKAPSRPDAQLVFDFTKDIR